MVNKEHSFGYFWCFALTFSTHNTKSSRLNTSLTIMPAKKKSSTYRGRAFCLTCNNYTTEDIIAIKTVVRDTAVEGCCIIGREGRDGTPHLQAFVHIGTHAAMTSKAFRKKLVTLFKETHWYCEAANDPSPHRAAIGYCCKGEGADDRFDTAKAEAAEGEEPGWATFHAWEGEVASDFDCEWQWGHPPQQGKRKDIDALAAACQDLSTPLNDALAADAGVATAFLKYPNGAKALRTAMIMRAPRALTEPPTVVVLYGATGTGKSYTINDIIRKLDKPVHVQSTGLNNGQVLWMDGYDGQPIVWFSEYRSGVQFSKMLEILDKYEVKVQIKGGTTQLLADTFFFCSPVSPEEWYKQLFEDDGSKQQLLRRITKTIHMDGSGGKDRSPECQQQVKELYNMFNLPDPNEELPEPPVLQRMNAMPPQTPAVPDWDGIDLLCDEVLPPAPVLAPMDSDF